jgi:hypothetical protein
MRPYRHSGTPTKANTTARGYGHTHQQERRRWLPIVQAGEAYCAEPICLHANRWIAPDAEWHLAHNRDTGGYRGPAHARCNTSEGARYRNHIQDPVPVPLGPKGW